MSENQTQIGDTCASIIHPDEVEYDDSDDERLECSVCHSTRVLLMYLDNGGSDQYDGNALCKNCIIVAFESKRTF